MAKYKAVGEVYNVRERMSEENGLSGEWDDNPDWYEYEMFLYDPKGEIVDSWDSLSETYNGMQKLTESEAKKSAKRVEDDVAKGNVSTWFSHAPAGADSKPRAKKSSAKRKSTKRLSSTPTSIRGMR